MSTKEQAIKILEQFSEAELVAFIILFGKKYPNAISPEEYQKYVEMVAVDE